ncbi:MAG: FAD-dependent oxidoreductase [Pyrinomonadaceae bacterium]
MKTFTRREILAAFLGAPFALAACRTENNSSHISGEIIGASADLGHRLRDGNLNFEIPPDRWETSKVVIVGGGAAGLSAAWKLQKEGFNDFVLLELEKASGGTARSGESSICKFPWGAHYLPVPSRENAELIELLDEMQLLEGKNANGEPIVAEQFLCREPEERTFYKGRWYEGTYLRVGASEEDLRQLNNFQQEINYWVSWRDAHGKRAFTIPVGACSNDPFVTDLDKITFADWLKNKNFTSPRLLWWCDYACRDDYGLKLEQTSAWAGLFYFCSRVSKAGEESAAFITFPEGNGRFVNHLHSKSKKEIRLSQAVYEIVPNDAGVDVLTFDAETNMMRGIHAEKVIFAAPIFLTKYLIRDFKQNTPAFVAEFEHNAWFVANLTLKDRPKNKFRKDFPLSWDNVIYESPSLGYVNSTHQQEIDYGATIFTYYFPMCESGIDPKAGRSKLFSFDWQACADVVLSDLSRAHNDIRDLTTRIDVMRWGHAMISPRPNFLWSGVRAQAATPFRNVYFAHSDLSGVALFEEAFDQGLRAAREIIQTLR